MFSTFVGVPHSPRQEPYVRHLSTSAASARTKRHQVARACDWCRAHRVKCDASYPCRNCKIKGRQCSKAGSNEVPTFSRAISEIERLKRRVKELEEQLESYELRANKLEEQLKNRDCSLRDSVLSRSVPSVKSSASLPANLDPLREHGGNRRYLNWECIYTRTSKSHQKQCYGPSSSFYFIGRMNTYLCHTLQQPLLDHHIQLNSTTRSFVRPDFAGRSSFRGRPNRTVVPMTGIFMSKAQEENLLNMFWQTYHCSYPILDEAEFRVHQKSLWTASGTSRKPSALVDIVLAICMQYGTASLSPVDANSDCNANADSNDATIAGRWLYRRCQILLADELEGPSIRTLQCHVFAVIWLSNASFHNMAHSTLALAVRLGIILGLHLEPHEDLPKARREFRKRLWWTLYALDIKAAMELGRPLAVSISQVTCSLPADDHEAAALSDSISAFSFKDVNCVYSSSQQVRLILATRAIYVTFYHKCAEVLGENGQRNLHDDPRALESCAEFLLFKMEYLHTWLCDVPDVLKTKRKNGGEPFSTDRSPLDLKQFAPFWLQRQRVLLELLYHNLAVILYRPFISFSRNTSTCTPLTEGNAISCVNHAITITHTIHQILTETDILSGWHETFQWQWSASLSLIGYIIAYPVGPSTPSARKAVDSAIQVFEVLANVFASAASAAKVVRDLAARADHLIDRFRSSLLNPYILDSEDTQNYDSHMLDGLDLGSPILPPQLAGDSSEMMQDALASSTVLPFTSDSFHSLGSLWTDGSDLLDTWTFGQSEQADPFLRQLMSSWETGAEFGGDRE